MNRNEYEDYVEMLARNGKRMGECPETVAQVATIAVTNMGTSKTFRFAAEPYVDDPVEQTRLWPKDVLLNSQRALDASKPDELRDLAVAVLADDIRDAMAEVKA